MRATFTMRNWTPPVGPPIEIKTLSGTATLAAGQLTVANAEGQLYGGELKGSATVKWSAGLAAEGEFQLKGADFGALLAAFTDEFGATGSLEATAKFALAGRDARDLFAAPRLNGTFVLQKGALNNVDLVRAIQTPGRGIRGGRTAFNEVAGDFRVANNTLAYRNLRLTSGPMSAGGSVEISAESKLSGRLEVALGTTGTTVARGALTVSGTVKDPFLGQ